MLYPEGLPVFLDGPRCHQTSGYKTTTCFVILSTFYSDVEYPRGGTWIRLCMYMYRRSTELPWR